MSLFGAMSTAISGLAAQSASFSNISDNVANSQTVGYKRTDTTFDDYLTTSTSSVNDSGSVVARPDYINTVQGTITQTDNTTALAISGNGFFSVSRPAGDANSGVFDAQQYYTRDGNFTMDKSGYLVNDSSDVLNGWTANPTTGVVSQGATAPIQISQASLPPTPTANITLAANLPQTPASGSTPSSDVQVYDSSGASHTIELSWSQNSTNDWTVTATAPDNQGGATLGTAEVTFGTNGTAAGTIGNITNTTGALSSAGYSANGPATITMSPNFGAGTQPISLNLGTFGATNGLTQFAGTTYTMTGISQDGLAAGNFTGVSMQSNGDVVAAYDNGQTRTLAQVPVATFPDSDALQKQDGQAYTVTQGSGLPTVNAPAQGSAGTLVTSATEASNVDIASEFTKLIVAQQAYAANTKVVTTANTMLQQTLDMKQ